MNSFLRTFAFCVLPSESVLSSKIIASLHHGIISQSKPKTQFSIQIPIPISMLSGRTSSILFFWPSLTLPARQQWARAFWMMCLLDLELGSLYSFGPA